MEYTCEWFEEGSFIDGTQDGPKCGKPAPYLACVPYVETHVCAEHRCRCSKRLAEQQHHEASPLPIPPSLMGQLRFEAEGRKKDAELPKTEAVLQLGQRIVELEAKLAEAERGRGYAESMAKVYDKTATKMYKQSMSCGDELDRVKKTVSDHEKHNEKMLKLVEASSLEVKSLREKLAVSKDTEASLRKVYNDVVDQRTRDLERFSGLILEAREKIKVVVQGVKALLDRQLVCMKRGCTAKASYVDNMDRDRRHVFCRLHGNSTCDDPLPYAEEFSLLASVMEGLTKKDPS